MNKTLEQNLKEFSEKLDIKFKEFMIEKFKEKSGDK